MGYGIVPDIKKEEVVCQSQCNHKDCAANRKTWGDAVCSICKKPMLPGQAFYYDDDNKPEHAGCLWDKVEREQALK